MSRINDDNIEYYRYTGPGRLNKAVHELHGMLLGITADAKTSDEELAHVLHWLDEHREFRNKSPFAEVFDMLETVVADRIIDEGELADLFWMCGKFTAENGYYDQITADMQRLHGMMKGIASDGIITAEELRTLDRWIGSRSNLKGCWPYDELESLVTHILKDGKVSSEEQSQLFRFLGEFVSVPGHRTLQVTDEIVDFAIDGICALAPEILFEGNIFCLTGTSNRAPRREIERIIVDRGGLFSKNVTQKVKYLVVGSEGNPCWAFSCYGRKVEEAMTLRKMGHKIAIVHEVDFWDHVA